MNPDEARVMATVRLVRLEGLQPVGERTMTVTTLRSELPAEIARQAERMTRALLKEEHGQEA